MPTQKIPDSEIRSHIAAGKTNNWIHTTLKVGMDRIKRLRDMEAIQPTYLPTEQPTDEEVTDDVSPTPSPIVARGLIVDELPDPEPEVELWFCITQAELKKLPEWLLHRVIKRC